MLFLLAILMRLPWIFLEKFYFLAANGYICIVCSHWFDLRTDVLLWRTEYVVPDRNTEL